MLAEREQQGRDNCAKPNLLPFYRAIREYLEDHGEEDGGESKREYQMYDAQDGRKPREQPIKIIAEGCQRRADDERHQQQEADHQDDRKAQKTRFQEMPYAGAAARRNLPDDIEGRLEFAQYGGGSDDQGADADRGRKDSGLSATGTPQHSLHSYRALRTDEVRKFAKQRTFRRFLTEGEPGYRDHHDQYRRKREYRVIRDRRTHRRGAVVEPPVNGFFAQA